MKLFALICILLASIPAFAEKMVHIGLASNFSELSTISFNPYGGYFRNGINLAIEQNKALLKQKDINLVVKEYDYGSDDLNVMKIVDQADHDGASAVIGYNYSSNALMAAPLHIRKRIPMLSPSASANRLGSFGKYVHLGSFSNEFMSKVLANFALKTLGAKKILIIPAANCAYCVDLTQTFEREFKKNGGQIVAQFPVLQEDKEFKELASKVRDLKFDAIFIPNQELTAARIILTLLEAGVQKPFLGADGWGNEGSEFFSVLKKRTFEGYSVTHWHPSLSTEKSKSFVKAYVKNYGKSPNDTSVLAYDFMNFLIKGIIAAKSLDRESLEASLQGIRLFEGVTGTYILSPNKAPAKDIVILKTSEDRFIVDRVIPVNARGRL